MPRDGLAAGVQRDQRPGAARERAVRRVVVGELAQVVGRDGEGHGEVGAAGQDHGPQ